MLFNNSTIVIRLVLKISGIVSSSSSFLYEYAVYNLKHFPGWFLPALPAR